MKFNEYQQLTLRTCSPEGHQHFFEGPSGAISEKEFYIQLKTFNFRVGLLHALTKCSEEVGEMWKPVNRALWYGKEIGPDEIKNIKEEAGDLLWYLGGPLCRALGCTFEEIAAMNIQKLAKRYPNSFSEKDALERKDEASSACPGCADVPKGVCEVCGSGTTLPESKRLRFLSDEEKKAIRDKYFKEDKYNQVDFGDGYYYSNPDRAWLLCPELWEDLPEESQSEREACKELNEELDTATLPAIALAEHLDRMGAASCEIPLVHNENKYRIRVERLFSTDENTQPLPFDDQGGCH